MLPLPSMPIEALALLQSEGAQVYDPWTILEGEQSWEELGPPEPVERARANKPVLWSQSISLNDSTNSSTAAKMLEAGGAQRRMEGGTAMAANGIYHPTLVPYEDKRIAGVSQLIFSMNG